MKTPYPDIPPPDGFGPWHRHDPIGYDEPDIPAFMAERDKVAVMVEGQPEPWIDAAGNLYWNPGGDQILFYALPESHLYAHFPPDRQIHVDTTGMDQHPLWGAF